MQETGHGSFRFERRAAPRTPATGKAAAVYTDGFGRAGVTPIELVDSSAGGIGLRSRSRIEPGMIVTLFSGSGTSWTEATAVRCVPDGDAWRVGLVVALRAAA